MILYAVIARSSDGAILSENSTIGIKGNHPQVTAELLRSLSSQPSRMSAGSRHSFLSDADLESSTPFDHFYHILVGRDAVYVCLSDDSTNQGQSVNFMFLEQLQEEFEKKYSSKKLQGVNAYGMDKGFSNKILQLIHEYNINRNSIGMSEKVAKLTHELDSLKVMMGHNIRLVLEREGKLDNLIQESDNLVDETRVFKRRSQLARNSVLRVDKYNNVLVAFLVIFFLYLICATLCGFSLNQCKK